MASQGSRLAVVSAGNGAIAAADVEVAISEILPHARDTLIELESRG